MKKFVKIFDVGKYIYFKNRKVRTPVTLEVTKDELKKLEVSLKMAGIENFKVSLKSEPSKEPQLNINVFENKNVIVEELNIEDLKPETVLEELIRNGEKE